MLYKFLLQFKYFKMKFVNFFIKLWKNFEDLILKKAKKRKKNYNQSNKFIFFHFLWGKIKASNWNFNRN